MPSSDLRKLFGRSAQRESERRNGKCSEDDREAEQHALLRGGRDRAVRFVGELGGGVQDEEERVGLVLVWLGVAGESEGWGGRAGVELAEEAVGLISCIENAGAGVGEVDSCVFRQSPDVVTDLSVELCHPRLKHGLQECKISVRAQRSHIKTVRTKRSSGPNASPARAFLVLSSFARRRKSSTLYRKSSSGVMARRSLSKSVWMVRSPGTACCQSRDKERSGNGQQLTDEDVRRMVDKEADDVHETSHVEELHLCQQRKRHQHVLRSVAASCRCRCAERKLRPHLLTIQGGVV